MLLSKANLAPAAVAGRNKREPACEVDVTRKIKKVKETRNR